MGLEKQIIDIPLGGGLEAKVDPKLVQPGQSIVLENAEFVAPGAVNKRAGYTALSPSLLSGGTIGYGRSLHKYGDRLVLNDGRNTQAWSPTAAKWVRPTTSPNMAQTRYGPLPGSALPSAYSPSVMPVVAHTAIANGVMVYAFRDYDQKVYWAAVDTVTGSLLTALTTISVALAAYMCRVCVSGNYIAILAGSNNGIGLTVYDTSTLTTVASNVALVADLNAAGMYDVAATSTVGDFVIAYENTTPTLTVLKFTTAAGASTTVAENPGGKHVGIVVSAAGDIYVAYRNNATNRARAAGLTSALGVLFAPADMDTTAGTDQFCGIEQAANTVRWYYSISGASQRRVVSSTSNSAGTIGPITAIRRGCCIASKPFMPGGAHVTNVFIVVAYTSGNAAGVQSGLYLLGDTTGAIFGRFLGDRAFLESQFATILPSPAQVAQKSTNVWVTGSGFGSSGDLLLDTLYYQPCLLTVDFSQRPTSAEIGGNLLLATGGMLWELDGAAVYENGFFVYPEPVTAIQSAAAGTIADGTYQVVAVYAYIDASGNFQIGPPSPAVSVTIAAGGGVAKIAVTVPQLRMSVRGATAYVLIYCTELGGSTLYEVIALPNNPAVDTVTSNITSVANINDNRELYTTGGVLENNAPPALSNIIRRGGRVYAMAQDGLLYYSKEILAGEAAAFVSETTTKQLQTDGGSYYALADLDGRLVVVGQYSLQVLSGEGIDELGTNDTLSVPQPIATDLGASIHSPIVTTPVGVLYKSPRGFVLLDRSLTPQLIGAPVDAHKSLTTVSAVLVPDKNQVRFGHSDGSTIVYDYLTQQWSVFTNHTQVDAIYWSSKYHYLTSGGQVYQQSTAFVDNVASIGVVIETPWIHVGSLQGMQRVLMMGVLGEWRSAHTLTARIYYDHDGSSVAETVTWDLSSGYTVGQPLQVRHRLGNQCKAIKVRLEDSAQAGTRESATFATLSLEIGGKGGIFRSAQAQTA